ncbi:hypothetical protein [Pseudoalteromonas rubra]|nr:hypothetical protein [Pseudoalteromonas rubra]
MNTYQKFKSKAEQNSPDYTDYGCNVSDIAEPDAVCTQGAL